MRRGLLLSRHGGIRPLLDRLLQQRSEPAYLCVLQPRLPRGLQGHADERPAVLCELLENPVRVRLAKETPVNSRVEQAVFCDPQKKSVSIHSSSDRPTCRVRKHYNNGPRYLSIMQPIQSTDLINSRVTEGITKDGGTTIKNNICNVT